MHTTIQPCSCLLLSFRGFRGVLVLDKHAFIWYYFGLTKSNMVRSVDTPLVLECHSFVQWINIGEWEQIPWKPRVTQRSLIPSQKFFGSVWLCNKGLTWWAYFCILYGMSTGRKGVTIQSSDWEFDCSSPSLHIFQPCRIVSYWQMVWQNSKYFIIAVF